MDRLSSPLDQLKDHYDAVVVGSGYGGSIAACRLARAGLDVALLERGRELHPGEYPAGLEAAARRVQTSSPLGGTGDPRDLYWFHVGDEMSVFSGCGLGGTSLVNANVALRADPRVFEDERWPRGLRADAAGLEAGYARAEAMLTPSTYPASFPPLAKVEALRKAAGEAPVALTPINVTFRAGPNAAGVPQEACTGCGDCVTGCNYWAKNTLLMNYLPDAVAHGASVFTEVDVRWVEPVTAIGTSGGTRWAVRAQPLGTGREHFDAPPLTVATDLVVLAAGTLGTTRVLLNSADHNVELSAQVGRHFTGNGDVLAFSYRRGRTVNAVGAGSETPDPKRPAGPCIAAVIDRRAGRPLSEGLIIEDAVVPGAVAGLLPLELWAQTAPDWLRGRLRGGGPLAALASVLSRGRRGMTRHLQTLLVMGNDDDEGILELEGDQIRVNWEGAGTSAYYELANRVVGDVAQGDGGTFLRDPLWGRLLHHSLITVHPLGGCVMAERAEDGVVDHLGRVFAGATGDAVHEGLVAWDGSIVPRPLGVNPLLTISALAERGVAALASENDWTIDYGAGTPGPQGPVPGPPARPGLRFTERMAGFWSPASEPDAGELAQYTEAARLGEEADRPLSFELTLSTDDLRAEVADLSRSMVAVGTVEAPAISPDPLDVEGGTFQLLAPDDVDTAMSHMWYRLPLRATDGRRLHFSGFKSLGPGDLSELWPATTTLYVTLRDGDQRGPVIGRGVLRIALGDFVRQLRTMAVTGPASETERLKLEAAFGRAFAGRLYDDFGSVVHRTTLFNRQAPPRRKRPLNLPDPHVVGYRTDDGLALRLTRYRGGGRGPVLLAHGMGANPLSFLLDTVEVNMVEYLVAHGFDVWVQEWRASTLLPTSNSQFDADTVARADHPAALEAVRKGAGTGDVHVVAHCVGSLTWAMATLAGAASPASLLCSSVALHPIGPLITRVKVGLRLGELMRRLGVGTLTSDAFVGESAGARAVDLALRAYPIPKGERCDQAVCRRLAFIYGIAVHHQNMNELTHTTMHELFGLTDMTMMVHLSRMARAERLVSAQGADSYLPYMDRLRMPITLVSGAANLVWVPASTERSYALLVGTLGGDTVRRVVFDGYGHQDVFIGARASEDTYPTVLEHLERSGA